MKKIIFSTMITSLLAFVGCQNEELVNENSTDNGYGKKVTITATIAGAADSRVALTPGTDSDRNPIVNVEWEERGETFKVHGSQPQWSEFTQTQGNNFQGTLPEGADCAYYGYTVSGNTISYDLSAQNGTLDKKCILMEADVSSSPSNITFDHKTAILKVDFQFKNTQDIIANTSIDKIMLDGANAGSGKEYITVEPSNLNDIYIFLPIDNTIDDTYSSSNKTFKFTVKVGNDYYAGNLNIPAGKIVAGNLYTATIKLETEPITPYVTFRVGKNQTQTLQLSNYVDKLEYSIDNGKNWDYFEEGKLQVEFGQGNDLLLRGSKNIYHAPSDGSLTFIFNDADVPVYCFGDIRTLTNYNDYASDVTEGCAYYANLFKGCTNLVSAPDLPLTQLSTSIYSSMFEGCTSLETAPELPSTMYALECYKSMFKGCTSLKTAPELPAVLRETTRAYECYSSMFEGCTSLETAPERLPIMTLKTGVHDHCYANMFKDCTSLKTAPELPATTLADNCYQSMFEGCTSLETAPELPANELQSGCYFRMFYGCTNLNSVTMLATNNDGLNSLSFWLDGVANSGTFTKASAAGWLSTGYGIPTGWTVISQ